MDRRFLPGEGKPLRYCCPVTVVSLCNKASMDWIAYGTRQLLDGHTADSKRRGSVLRAPGKATETRSSLRWKDPAKRIMKRAPSENALNFDFYNLI